MFNKISIFKNSSLLFMGNLAFALAQWALITYLSRQWGVVYVGYYSIALSYIAPLIAISNFGLRTILSGDVLNRHDAAELLKFRFRILIITSSIFWLVLILSLEEKDKIEIFFVVFVAKLIESISDYCYGLMYRNNNQISHGISLLMRSIFGAIMFFIGANSGGYLYGFLGIIIAWILVLFNYDIRVTGVKISDFNIFMKIPRRYYKYLLNKNSPLVYSTLLGSLLFNIPNYFLGGIYGLKYLGMFTTLFSFCVVMNMFCGSIGQTLLPSISRSFLDKNHGQVVDLVKSASILIVAISVVSSILAFFVGKYVVEFLFRFDTSVLEYSFPVLIFLSTPLFLGQFLSFVVQGTGRYDLLPKVATYATSIGFISAYPFIKLYGIKGASIVIMLMGLTQVLMYYRIISNKINEIRA